MRVAPTAVGSVPVLSRPVPRDGAGLRYPQWFGVNLVDMELPSINKNPAVYGVDYGFPSDAQVYYFAGKGLRLLRLGTCWEYLQPDLAGGLDSGNMARIDHLCQVAATCGCKVILSIMNEQYYTTSDGVQHIVGGVDGVVTAAQMNAFWVLLAAHYRGNPGVYAYDIMNEPSQFGTWDAQAQSLITAIRTVDTTTALIVQMTALWTTYSDPANNIIYSIHRYFDGTSVSVYPSEGFLGGPGYYHDTWENLGSYVAMGIDCATPFITWCRSNGVRGFFGEYGIPKGIYGSNPMQYDPRYLAVLDGFLATLRAGSDVIVGGTYFAAGTAYNSSYYAASYDMSQLPLGSGPYGLPDKPQMAVLQKYPTSATA